jgi:hypothetical protein
MRLNRMNKTYLPPTALTRGHTVMHSRSNLPKLTDTLVLPFSVTV